MKRYLCTALAAAILLSLCACSAVVDAKESIVLFYYPRKEITYGASDSVISSEARDARGNTEDLRYLLLLYLQGPTNSALRSPFPAGLQLVQAEQVEQTLYIFLGSSLDDLSDLEKTLACACLTLTCLGLTDADTVCITTEAGQLAGETPIVMDSSCLLLLDDSATIPMETTDE